MDKLFLTVLNMSLTGAFVIAAICLVRLLLKKAPKIISYCMWAVAGFRLVFPFSIDSVFSLMPFHAQPIPMDIAMQAEPRIDSGVTVIDHVISAALPGATPTASVNPMQILTAIGSFVWLTGIAVMLIYGVLSYIMLKRKMRKSFCVKANIYEAENINSPFVLGIVNPKIYLPTGLSIQERDYITIHEQTHLRRHDHIIKFTAYFILCLHWFNPLVWVAFLLLGVDMEMSCDERVLKETGSDTKKAYSLSLLSFATERRIIGGTPLAFGEGSVKQRIRNVLNFKKPSRIIIIAAAALVIVLSVGLAVNRSNNDIPDITATETIDGAQIKAIRFGYSWFNGIKGVTADSIAPWQGEYTDENTLVIDGEMGQNMIALSAESPDTASYVIYRPGGTIYDNGTREIYDSLGSRLYWTDDKTGIGLIAPFEPGEYICEVKLGWKKNDLQVTYGFKLIMTGKRNAYDEALNIIWNHHTDALHTTFIGVETLAGAEYAKDCYVFEVALPNSTERVAVSKDKGIYFTYSNGTWSAYTGALENDPVDQQSSISDDIVTIYFYGIGEFSGGPAIPLTQSQQQEIRTMLESASQLPVESSRDKSAYPTTVIIYIPGEDSALYCLRSDGTFQMSKDTMGKSDELFDYVSSLISEQTGTDLLGYDPSAIHSLISAELTFVGKTSVNDQSDIPVTQRITDPSALTQIEELFQNARPMTGVSSCPFGSMLTLTRDDGVTFQYQIADDSCAVALSAYGVCVEYGIKSNKGNDRSSFEKIFNLIPWL